MRGRQKQVSKKGRPGGSRGNNQKNNLVWWIFGWICFFPAPVMVLIWRKKNTWIIQKKVIVTAVFWFMLMILVACNSKTKTSEKHATTTSVKETKNDETMVRSTSEGNISYEAVVSEYDVIDTFIDKYNAIAENKLTNPVEIDIQDKEHYRHEFRLNAFEGAVAKQCTIGDTTVDIINYGSHGGYWSNGSIRMYLTTDDAEFAIAFFDSAAKILDPTLTETDIAEGNDDIRNGNSSLLKGVNFYFNKGYKQAFIDSEIEGFYGDN